MLHSISAINYSIMQFMPASAIRSLQPIGSRANSAQAGKPAAGRSEEERQDESFRSDRKFFGLLAIASAGPTDAQELTIVDTSVSNRVYLAGYTRHLSTIQKPYSQTFASRHVRENMSLRRLQSSCG